MSANDPKRTFRLFAAARWGPQELASCRARAATRMADNGATEAQLMAVFGWTDAKMATHYTRTANRRRLAAESIGKLDEGRTKAPAPSSPVPRTLLKAKR